MTLEVLRQFMTLTISTDCPPRSSTAPQHHPGHQHSKSNCLRSIKKTLHQAIRLGGFLSPFPSGLRLSAGMTCPPVKSMLRFVGLMATERTLSAWTSAGAVATKSSVAAGGCPSWPHQAPRTDKLGSQQPSPQLMQRRSGKETKWSAKTRRTSLGSFEEQVTKASSTWGPASCKANSGGSFGDDLIFLHLVSYNVYNKWATARA